MPNEPTFYMNVGLVGSGKTSFSEKFCKSNNVLHLSSDKIREEILGDVNDQTKNAEVFEELFRRADLALKNGRSVLVDATNVSRKKRKASIIRFAKYHKVCYYFDTPFEACVAHNGARERNVPVEVIERMYKQMDIPMYFEGWDEIEIVHNREPLSHANPDDWTQLFGDSVGWNHDAIFRLLSEFRVFRDIYDLPHDSTYHTFSVSRHTFHVFDGLKGQDMGLKWAGLLHDVGKRYTKQFREGKRYANFLNHENVGAQLTIGFLHDLGYDKNFILDVAQLVALHMKPMNAKPETLNELKQLTGDEFFGRLMMFHQADTDAK